MHLGSPQHDDRACCAAASEHITTREAGARDSLAHCMRCKVVCYCLPAVQTLGGTMCWAVHNIL